MNYDLLFWIGFIIVALGGVCVYIFLETRYKHKVVIREIVNGRKFIIVDRAKETVVDKVSWWKLRKERNKNSRLLPSGCFSFPLQRAVRRNVLINFFGKNLSSHRIQMIRISKIFEILVI